ncbi:polysaccharide biosynthesis/export family protein [Francisellaceae bacterium]|nr:polysaccharide biosynthesis/export family protein [Francisellaceae bacterium]
MKKQNILKLSSLTLATIFLAGCSFPGMHMTDQDDYTPSLNAQGKPEKAKLTPITAELISKQRRANKVKQIEASTRYKAPDGFSANSAGYTYEIGPQDVLNVIVWDYKSLTNPATNLINANSLKTSGFTVNSNGNIFYPYVGDVQVAGKTVAEARDILASELSKYLKDPQVTLQVVDFNSQHINVMGAVKQPLTLPVLNTPITVLDAVNAAGGPIRCGNALSNAAAGGGNQLTCADTRNVIIKQNGKQSVINLDTLMAADGSSENWILHNQSVVFIPNNDLYKVYILGETKQTGAFNMINGAMSLQDAIVAAGGVNDRSSPAYTYIVRSYEEKPEVFSIDLRSPDALLLAGQFDLKPHDIVFTSINKLASIGQIIGYIAPAASLGFSAATLGITLNR